MARYYVNRSSKINSDVQLKDIDGYKFKPRYRKDEYVKVSQITIVDRAMIDKILTMKFNKSFNRVAALAMAVINDEDATESDAEIVLGEVELVRDILLNRYQRFLSQKKEELFLKKLRVIENEIRMKAVAIKQKAIYLEQQEEYMRGRGR